MTTLLFIFLLFAFALSLWIMSLLLSPWLNNKNIDDLYSLLNIALLFVIVGVVIEEWELFWKTAKLLRLLLLRQYELARIKARQHAREAVASAGFLLLVFALAAELRLDPLIETRQKSDQLEKTEKIAKVENDAAAANTKAAALLAENVELEHALAPRDITFTSKMIEEINAIGQIPLFVWPVNSEESIHIAQSFSFFQEVQVKGRRPLDVKILPAAPWHRAGIQFEYVESVGFEVSVAQRVAVSLCESLRLQGISAGTLPVPMFAGPPPSSEWPAAAPTNAVLVSIGDKPNTFWLNKKLKEEGKQPEMETNFCTPEEFFKAADAVAKRRHLDHGTVK